MGRRNQLDIGALARAGVFEEVRGVASYKSLDIAGMAAEVRRLFSTQVSLASQTEFALVGLTVVFRQKCAKWLQGLTRIHDRMLGVYLTAAEKRRAHELLRDTIEFGVPKRICTEMDRPSNAPAEDSGSPSHIDAPLDRVPDVDPFLAHMLTAASEPQGSQAQQPMEGPSPNAQDCGDINNHTTVSVGPEIVSSQSDDLLTGLSASQSNALAEIEPVEGSLWEPKGFDRFPSFEAGSPGLEIGSPENFNESFEAPDYSPLNAEGFEQMDSSESEFLFDTYFDSPETRVGPQEADEASKGTEVPTRVGERELSVESLPKVVVPRYKTSSEWDETPISESTHDLDHQFVRFSRLMRSQASVEPYHERAIDTSVDWHKPVKIAQLGVPFWDRQDVETMVHMAIEQPEVDLAPPMLSTEEVVDFDDGFDGGFDAGVSPSMSPIRDMPPIEASSQIESHNSVEISLDFSMRGGESPELDISRVDLEEFKPRTRPIAVGSQLENLDPLKENSSESGLNDQGDNVQMETEDAMSGLSEYELQDEASYGTSDSMDSLGRPHSHFLRATDLDEAFKEMCQTVGVGESVTLEDFLEPRYPLYTFSMPDYLYMFAALASRSLVAISQDNVSPMAPIVITRLK